MKPRRKIPPWTWFDVLPYWIAKQQIKDERCRRVLRARRAGATYAEIGRHIGISGGRVAQLAHYAERRERSPWRTPVELYCTRIWGDLLELNAPSRIRAPRCDVWEGDWWYDVR